MNKGNQTSNLSRRNIVKAAAIVPFAAVSGTAANSAVTVGLIGAGNRGPRVSRQMVKNTGGRLAAICDLYEDKIKRAKEFIGAPDAKAYSDYENSLSGRGRSLRTSSLT